MKLSEIEVSVIIPVRNEHEYISACLESILSQDYPKDKMEIIFIDGVSEDDTTDVIKKYMEKYENIRLLSNPQKFVQHALNIGIKSAVGKYIVRMDAHSEYADDYISNCIKYLEKTGANNVGGPTVVKGKGRLQSVIASAYHSKFALGGGKNHNLDYEGFSDTVFLGSFRKNDIEKIGCYDERFIRNEDDDLSFTMIENGMKIFITPNIKSVYYPRTTYFSLFKQHFEYGMWKVAVIKKHGRPARLSHVVPMMFVAFLILFGLGSLFLKPLAVTFALVMGLYILLDAVFSFANNRVYRISDKLRLMLVHFIIHVAYGLGFWKGIFKFWNFK